MPDRRLILAALLAPSVALAAGPRLLLQQVEMSQKRWPHARAYLSVTGSTGAPIPQLPQDLFKVYEAGNGESARVEKVESLEAAQSGVSLVVVVQASGAMLGLRDSLQKAVAAFVNGLGPKDRVAIVSYSEGASTVSPFSGDKGEVAGKAATIPFTGKSFQLYDGLAQALALQAAGSRTGGLPAAQAIVVVSDGRDSGSATDVENVLSEAVALRIPIHAIGHSELEQDSLTNLEMIAKRTGGTYRAAPSAEDLAIAFASVEEFIAKTYVIQWKTQLEHDGKDHRIEIAMENEGGAPLRASALIRTPDFSGWVPVALAALGIVLIAAFTFQVFARLKPGAAAARARLASQKDGEKKG